MAENTAVIPNTAAISDFSREIKSAGDELENPLSAKRTQTLSVSVFCQIYLSASGITLCTSHPLTFILRHELQHEHYYNVGDSYYYLNIYVKIMSIEYLFLFWGKRDLPIPQCIVYLPCFVMVYLTVHMCLRRQYRPWQEDSILGI